VRLGVTTGTTGKPWMSFYSADDLDRMVATQFHHTWRAGLRRGHHFTHSWPSGLYPSAVLGGRHLLELGILEIPVGPPFSVAQAADHVRLWQSLGIDALMTTGSQLQIYDEAAESVGIDLPGLLAGGRLMFVEASCQFAEPRRRVEEAYGVRLHNLSGAGEVPGFVTSDCLYHTGLHAPPLGYVVQVCDPSSGCEVAAGERGSLVISTWGLDAFYLRYDLEDIVVASEGPCPCGQTGPRYTLIGRRADMAVVEGRMILPLDVQLALEQAGAPEFVLAAGPSSILQMRVETTGSGDDERRLVSEALGVTAEVEPIAPGSLPRSTFKPRRVITP
jgi:phenylacetate-CoA ligase